MKSRASLFLAVLLLALSLTACGKEPAKNDRNDAGSGQNSAYDAVSDPNRNNAPNNDAIIGRDDHTVTAPDTNPAPNPANEPAGDLPGASMDRMLRNGRVGTATCWTAKIPSPPAQTVGKAVIPLPP